MVEDTCRDDDKSAPGEVVRVRGLVQGVGFRPTIWRLARDCGLSGDVCNDAEGVLIHVWGGTEARLLFLHRLHREAPPLARIDALECAPLDRPAPDNQFRINASRSGHVHTGIAADAATCAECLREIEEPRNRRVAYAFTNCTQCGPRLSIVKRIPYDRANTSMSGFVMCPACRAEYEDPADRRFHAQPNACPDCGPRLWLEAARDTRLEIQGDPIGAARRLVRDGRIVAIKGIGGIHLACNATDRGAIERLRARKNRDHKPFAVMARDVTMIRRYCSLTVAEAKLLHSPAAPIVLLTANGPERLAAGVAPAQSGHGFMLPYSPLHHLLMAGLDVPIVLTSGNRSEEPQCIGNDEARDRLSGIVDALLLHDRDIVNRLDNSMIRLVADSPILLRRARGYAPAPLQLPAGFRAAPDVLAFGGELKNTFCLIKHGEAILSQHLGDLENAKANAAYLESLELYRDLFDHRPRIFAIDSHPEYLSSKIGREWAAETGSPLLTIQHHHAHIAACLADNGIDLRAPPVLGIALDGAGYGDDGTFWGGEFLLADYRGFTRLASLAPVPMPGGVRAIEQPWRMAYAHLRRVGDWSRLSAENAGLPFFKALAAKPLQTLNGMLETGFNSPMTSSCGRLFDAVAAVLGLREQVSYEGQAAIELEAVAGTAVVRESKSEGYPFAITVEAGLPRLEPGPMWRNLLRDLRAGIPASKIAARFHAGLARGVMFMIEYLTRLHFDAWAGRIALSGGVFQNALLTAELIRALEMKGLTVLRHGRVPANDGGLSLGQAAIAAAQAIDSQGNGNGD